MRILLFMLVLSISVSGCKQINAKQSVKINDEVIVHQKKLMAALENFVKALESKDENEIEKNLKNLQEASSKGLAAINYMTTSSCDKQFILAASNMFQYYNKASNDEYKSIGNLYAIDSISYEAFDSLQVLVEQFKDNQNRVNNKFLSAQKQFAKNCGFKLVQHAE